jgi:hypothetical protein
MQKAVALPMFVSTELQKKAWTECSSTTFLRLIVVSLFVNKYILKEQVIKQQSEPTDF